MIIDGMMDAFINMHSYKVYFKERLVLKTNDSELVDEVVNGFIDNGFGEQDYYVDTEICEGEQ